MTERATPSPRSHFSVFYQLNSRWADNDIYGHINNVAYYAFFDSVVNRFLIEEGGMRPGIDSVVGYVVSSSADYFSPLSYPQGLELGLRISRMGEKSVTWEIGVFAEDAELSSVTG
ncbi:MAG: acyl-CoA thioesterase, partial [Pseudomonadota bacterium]|nr:acyl-CoA thioesterase [Pseudomonadota bacterium]